MLRQAVEEQIKEREKWLDAHNKDIVQQEINEGQMYEGNGR